MVEQLEVLTYRSLTAIGWCCFLAVCDKATISVLQVVSLGLQRSTRPTL